MNHCDECGGYGEVFLDISPRFTTLVRCICEKESKEEQPAPDFFDLIEQPEEVVEKIKACRGCGYPENDCGCPPKKNYSVY